jgi:hypothetical protein
MAVLAATALFGCGSDAKSTSTPPGPTCSNAATPTPFTLTDVTPAAGASVPNQAIVQKFPSAPGGSIQQLSVEYSAAHTAGIPTPAPEYTIATDANGASVFEFMPITWETAPGHVEILLGAGKSFSPPRATSVTPFPILSSHTTSRHRKLLCA